MTITNAAKHHEPVEHNTNAENIARPFGMLAISTACHPPFVWSLFARKRHSFWIHKQLHWLSRSVVAVLGVALCVILREHLWTKAVNTGHKKEVETKSKPTALLSTSALPITCLWSHVTWRSTPVGTLETPGSAPFSKCQNRRETFWKLVGIPRWPSLCERGTPFLNGQDKP